jgi:hypothetical protein
MYWWAGLFGYNEFYRIHWLDKKAIKWFQEKNNI